MDDSNPVKLALSKYADSPTKLAEAIGGNVKRQHIEHWLDVGRVPIEHAPKVNELTGIPLWDLCPLKWHRVWPSLTQLKGAPALPADEEKAGV